MIRCCFELSAPFTFYSDISLCLTTFIKTEGYPHISVYSYMQCFYWLPHSHFALTNSKGIWLLGKGTDFESKAGFSLLCLVVRIGFFSFFSLVSKAYNLFVTSSYRMGLLQVYHRILSLWLSLTFTAAGAAHHQSLGIVRTLTHILSFRLVLFKFIKSGWYFIL